MTGSIVILVRYNNKLTNWTLCFYVLKKGEVKNIGVPHVLNSY